MNRKNSLFSQRPKTKNSVKKKTTYPETLRVEGFSHEGRGIAKHEGKTLFISGALPGEEVKFTVEKTHRRFDEASCTEIIEASEHRTSPACQYFDQCGGCDLQHLQHQQQIETKQSWVLDQLQRLGGFQPNSIHTPLRSSEWAYRRSCRLGINQLMRDGSAIVGYRRKASNKLIAIEHCPVLEDPLNKILKELPTLLETEDNFKYITHAELSLADNQGSITLRVKKSLSENLLKRFSELAVQNNFQLHIDDGTSVKPTTLNLPLYYTVNHSNTQINFQPGDFIQVNATVNNAMIEQAIDWLELSTEDRVLDLFCGIGNFTLPVARYVNNLVGVEGVEEMVLRAGKNAEINGLTNCDFYRADLTKDLRALPWYKQGFNKIILDPPRSGAIDVIQQLGSHNPDYILYISCNPAALARDGSELIKQGYKAERFCVMDMFPHTSHVESMLLFVKSNA